MVNIFILCVDRDGEEGRSQRLNEIEAEFGDIFFAENAWEEIETWLLAGLRLPSNWNWKEVRKESPSQRTCTSSFSLLERGLSDSPGGGRKTLGDEAARRIGEIRRKCPEDFDCSCPSS